jgi:hypothetical protein
LGTAWLFGYFSGDITPASQGSWAIIPSTSTDSLILFGIPVFLNLFPCMPTSRKKDLHIWGGNYFFIERHVGSPFFALCGPDKKNGEVNLPGKLKIPYSLWRWFLPL